MSSGATGRVIYGLAAASFALVLLALVLTALSWDVPLPATWGFRGYALLQATAFTAVGALIARRRPANIVGWLLLTAGVVAAVGSLGLAVGEYTVAAHHPGRSYGVYGAWLGSWIWTPVVSVLLPMVLLRFPDGWLITPRLRIVESLAFVTSGGLACFMALRPGPLQLATYLDNPVAIDAPVLINVFLGLGMLAFVILGAAAWSIVVRFRRSVGIERQQLKWLAFSALPFAVAGLGSAVLHAKAVEVLHIFLQLFVPVAIGIAILRYRLYDIDTVINRALVYGATTATIAVAFFAGIVILQTLLRPLTSGSEVAVAISTLASVALFQPLRTRVQRAVDRRFYRSRYDAARTLDEFSVRLRDQVALDAVRADLLDAVRETVQPAHASVWLRGTSR